MNTREKILKDIQDFIDSSGISAHQFGMRAVHNHKLIKRLKGGCNITLENIDKIYELIGSHK